MKLQRSLPFVIALLLLSATVEAQVKTLCDGSTNCAVGADFAVGDDVTVAGDFTLQSPRGAISNLKFVESQVTLSGATTAATGLIPAGSTVYGCVAKVTTAVTGATTWDLGDGTDADKWCNDVGLTAGTACSPANATVGAPAWYAAATNPTFTANGSNFTGGVVRLSCMVGYTQAATN